eukprot:jgi/Psemu1/18736/gm1.18736_g
MSIETHYRKPKIIHLKRNGVHLKPTHLDLPVGNLSHPPILFPAKLPLFPSLLLVNPIITPCFVDAVHDNVHPCCKSTSSISILLLANTVIIYNSKLQTQTALSSTTDAEFYATFSAAKLVLYFCSILDVLGYPQHLLATIYEDNDSTIKIINNGKQCDLINKMPTFIEGKKLNPANALTKPLA